MSSRARTKEVGQCSYRVAKQLRQGLPWELIHALFPWEKSRTPMSGTIVLYDGGAVAPHNQHGARGHRGGGGYRRANISQAPSQSKKLKTGVCLERRQALLAPPLGCCSAISPGCCRLSCGLPSRAPRGGPAMSLPAASVARPNPRLPNIRVTLAQAPSSNDLDERLQRVLQQALNPGLGPPRQRRPAVVA